MAAAFLLTILCALSGGSAARAATIKGTIFDPAGRPVAGARVSLVGKFEPIEPRRTDSAGRFRFNHLAAGTYRLVASSPGLTAASKAIVIAGEAETKTQDLHMELSAVEQHVVVSATLGGSLASELGSSVSVVTRKEIEDRGAENAFEVLRGVPGVEVNQTGRRGGVTGVFIRGGDSDYNLVMIDGIPMNEFGGAIDFSSLPADGIERIEVTRGPASALYGSNAVTGVVNIVSTRGDGPAHFSGLAETGSHLTRRFAAGGSGLNRGVSWAFDLSRLDTDGVVTNDQYRDQSAFLSLGYSRSPRREIFFHFFGNANDAGAPGPFGSDPDHLFPGIDTVSRDKQNLFGYEWNYSEQFSPHFRQVVSGALATNDYYFISPYGDSYSNNWRGVVNTRSEIVVSSHDFFAGGFEYNREQIKNTYIADANNNPFLLPRASYAAFAENRWIPNHRLAVNAGVRLDEIHTHELPPDAFGSRPLLPASRVAQVSPRVAAAYLARDASSGALGLTRIHASFGTGLRAPSGFELAFTNNPDLKPEKSVSFDAGFEQRFFGSRADVDATYFYNRFKDQIVVLGGSLANLSSFVSDNLGNSRARGLELSFHAQPAASLRLTAEYTLDDTEILALNGSDRALAPLRVGQQLFRRPRNSGFFELTWTHHRLMLEENTTIRGAVLDIEPNDGLYACSLTDASGNSLPCLFTNKGYTLANAGFSYRLAHGVELYGRLNNFLNQKYEESLGFPALRLNFLAGIKFNFPAE
jgi:outer membrane receptor protein involved in Fe transport